MPLCQDETLAGRAILVLTKQAPGDEIMYANMLPFFFQAEDGIRDIGVTGVQSVLFRSWAVVDATRNEHLRRAIADLRPHTARLRNLSHVDPQRVDVSVAEHLVICDALLRGDADEAAARTADHLEGSLETIFRTLATGPGAGLDLLA